MSRLTWDGSGQKKYQCGVDQVVLYVGNKTGVTTTLDENHKFKGCVKKAKTQGDLTIVDPTYKTGVAWNGITAINESPTGGETTTLYADNIAYCNITSAEKYAYSIEAYDYPDEFAVCDGVATISVPGTSSNTDKPFMKVGQQSRRSFALCYRTQLGSDTSELGEDYKINLVYGCKAAVSGKNHSTINESPDAGSMSWECSATTQSFLTNAATTAEEIKTAKVELQKSVFVGNSNKNKWTTSYEEIWNALNDILLGYGSGYGGADTSGDAYCMSPQNIYDFVNYFDPKKGFGS